METNQVTPPETIEDTNSFSVFTYSVQDAKDKNYYQHWSEGLNMVITKSGISIMLNSEETQKIVKSLPKTIGGNY